jgi:hypothetical protein
VTSEPSPAPNRQNWSEILPDEDYRFHFGLKSGSAQDFFAPTSQRDIFLCQRAHWLDAEPVKYAAMLTEAAPLLDETIALAQSWQPTPPISIPQADDPLARLISLGKQWEPDFLLLKPDAEKRIQLLGGCVCFPSSWRLTDKVGHPLEFIHSPVPNLNATLANSINQFLTRLRPGIASLRSNWGLSHSPELNQHPEQNVPRLNSSVGLQDVWLRIENQALVALPASKGILFGIRLEIHSLETIKSQPIASKGLARALRTMPSEMADYKNLLHSRDRIASLLES